MFLCDLVNDIILCESSTATLQDTFDSEWLCPFIQEQAPGGRQILGYAVFHDYFVPVPKPRND